MRDEAASPRGKGGIPRRVILQSALGAVSAAALGNIGCSSSDRDARTFGPYVVALKPDTPAAIVGPEASLFQVKREVPLPIKSWPEDVAATPPYPRPGVWYTPDKLRVQLSYVISNLEPTNVQVELLVDAWNEFVVYQPQVRIVDDEVLPDRSCVQRLMIVPGRSRVEGRVSFDDFERVAIALAGIMNNAPNPFHLLDPTTKLYESPLSRDHIPGIISGITGFDLSLRSTAAVRVAVEAIVEVIDLGEILMDEGEEGTSTNRRAVDRRRRPLIPVVAVEE
jgi:hypothetical protein